MPRGCHLRPPFAVAARRSDADPLPLAPAERPDSPLGGCGTHPVGCDGAAACRQGRSGGQGRGEGRERARERGNASLCPSLPRRAPTAIAAADLIPACRRTADPSPSPSTQTDGFAHPSICPPASIRKRRHRWAAAPCGHHQLDLPAASACPHIAPGPAGRPVPPLGGGVQRLYGGGGAAACRQGQRGCQGQCERERAREGGGVVGGGV